MVLVVHNVLGVLVPQGFLWFWFFMCSHSLGDSGSSGIPMVLVVQSVVRILVLHGFL